MTRVSASDGENPLNGRLTLVSPRGSRRHGSDSSTRAAAAFRMVVLERTGWDNRNRPTAPWRDGAVGGMTYRA